uniref:Caspase recruitment domain-containing protein 11-like isoform X1 n=2 Tax=Petromyzon marinus TaxID=7757 RepID=A0AAJ7TGW8_PETMA|nr:caspase recruitment domain-containing protein 11-like isoform X1 [Petromyzon marinus]XP_032817184.1 caspase recruitment domain-containing protein 11-like isoform X1 [Petromyzon marinus]XP_032817185.1 caspase recruitment domain-containing protein 11-like isoform X1 [Petromyzon marinus]XP_032817187.1 caspase recruitment domain-containing protein 11-like isoform X1 [Petromyzon marinus]
MLKTGNCAAKERIAGSEPAQGGGTMASNARGGIFGVHLGGGILGRGAVRGRIHRETLSTGEMTGRTAASGVNVREHISAGGAGGLGRAGGTLGGGMEGMVEDTSAAGMLGADLREEELEAHLWDEVENHRMRLTSVIDPARLTPYLRQCRVIDGQDEDEVLNSLSLSTRSRRVGVLLDILRSRGTRGHVAFLESLELHYAELYKQLTGNEPTRRFSTIIGVEGQDGLLHFLMAEVMRQQLQLAEGKQQRAELHERASRLETDGRRLALQNRELQAYKDRFGRMKEERNGYNDELIKVKDENYTLAMKYAQLSEEKNMAVIRSRDLQLEIDQLKHSLNKAEEEYALERRASLRLQHDMEANPGRERLVELERTNLALSTKVAEMQVLLQSRSQGSPDSDQAMLDILETDRREALEERHDLVNKIFSLREEMRQAEELRDKYLEEKQDLELRCNTLLKDCEMYKHRIGTVLQQLEEVERERDQAFSLRDESQRQYSQSLLDKDKYRKQIRELEEKNYELQIGQVRSDGEVLLLTARLHKATNVADSTRDLQTLPARLNPHTIEQFWQASDGKSGKSTEESTSESDGSESKKKHPPVRQKIVKKQRVKVIKQRTLPSQLNFGKPECEATGTPGEENGDSANSGDDDCDDTQDAHNMYFSRMANDEQRDRFNSVMSTEVEPPGQESIKSRVQEYKKRPMPRRSSTVSENNVREEDEDSLCLGGVDTAAGDACSYPHTPLIPLSPLCRTYVANGERSGSSSCRSSLASSGCDSLLGNMESLLAELDLDNRPFRPSAFSVSVPTAPVRPTLQASLSAVSLRDDVTVIGGNESGVFVRSVRPGSSTERAGLKPGYQLLALEGKVKGEVQKVSLENSTKEETHWALQHCQGLVQLFVRTNMDGHRKLQALLEGGTVTSGDSFFVLVNASVCGLAEGCTMHAACEDVLHVTDTLYEGRAEWRCSRVDPYTMRDGETGTLPSFLRAQQLLLAKLKRLMNRRTSSDETDLYGAQGKMRKASLQCSCSLPSDVGPRAVDTGRPGGSGLRVGVIDHFLQQLLGRSEVQPYKRQSSGERMRLMAGTAGPLRWAWEAPASLDGIEREREADSSGQAALMPYTLVRPCRPPCRRPVLLLPSFLCRIVYPKFTGPDFTECPMGFRRAKLCPAALVPASSCSATRAEEAQREELAERQQKGDLLGWREEKNNSVTVCSVRGVEEVIATNKHCLLDLGLECITRLHHAEVYPIIVHVCLGDKNIRKIRKLLGKLDRSDEEVLRQCRAEEKALEALPCLYARLGAGGQQSWASAEELARAVQERVADEQRRIVWIGLTDPVPNEKQP